MCACVLSVRARVPGTERVRQNDRGLEKQFSVKVSVNTDHRLASEQLSVPDEEKEKGETTERKEK